MSISGITTFENEFLAFTVLPNGGTFGDWANEHLEEAIAAGEMPTFNMLPERAGPDR